MIFGGNNGEIWHDSADLGPPPPCQML